MDIDSYATDEERGRGGGVGGGVGGGGGYTSSSLSPYKNQNWFKNKNKSDAPAQSGTVAYISTLEKSPS